MKMKLWNRIGLLVLLALNAPLAFAANAPAGTIKLIKGEVQLLDSKAVLVGDTAGKTKRPLTVGAPFYVGETVVTKADGRVKLEFVEGKNEVVLGTNTSLMIERASTDPLKASGTTLSLARGEVRSSVNHKYSGKGGDAYEVKTPNAVAGVRGTIFMARFNPANMKSEVATERGLVAVKSLSAGGAGKEVMVRPGMFTAAVGTAPAAAPAPLSSNKDLEGAVKSLGSGGNESSEGGDSAKNDAGTPTAASNDKGDKAEGSEAKQDAAPASDSKENAVAKKEDAPAKGETASTDKADNKSEQGAESSAAKGDNKSEKGAESSVAKGENKNDAPKKDEAPAPAANDKKDGGTTAKNDAPAKNDVPAKSDAPPKNETAKSDAPAKPAPNGDAPAAPKKDAPVAASNGNAPKSNSSSGSSSVPLGREPVMASSGSGANRVPASIGPPAVPAGLSNVKTTPIGPPPMTNIANQTINRTVTNVNTINQTVNQQTQQAQHVMSKIRIRIQ